VLANFRFLGSSFFFRLERYAGDEVRSTVEQPYLTIPRSSA